MPQIDRRKFALGLLVMPLTACSDLGTATFATAAEPQAFPQPVFRNYGYWANSSTFVATGSVKP